MQLTVPHSRHHQNPTLKPSQLDSLPSLRLLRPAVRNMSTSMLSSNESSCFKRSKGHRSSVETVHPRVITLHLKEKNIHSRRRMKREIGEIERSFKSNYPTSPLPNHPTRSCSSNRFSLMTIANPSEVWFRSRTFHSRNGSPLGLLLIGGRLPPRSLLHTRIVFDLEPTTDSLSSSSFMTCYPRLRRRHCSSPSGTTPMEGRSGTPTKDTIIRFYLKRSSLRH